MNAGTQAEQDEMADPLFARSEAIKAEYLASGCQASDVDEAVEKLMAECGELFEDDRAAWEFLMEEPHEDNEDAKASRYLVAEGWDHIFEGFGQRTVRFVFDRNADKIVHMDIEFGVGGWKPATARQLADVEDSLKTANEDAFEQPDEYGLDEADEPPEWAASAPHTK